jgi:hypothetical protein
LKNALHGGLIGTIYGILDSLPGNEMDAKSFEFLYSKFQTPIAEFDCGERCAPYNEKGVPFCCDTHHTIPAAYQAEWEYLQVSTDLWHPWEGDSRAETEALASMLPAGMLMIACKGHLFCERDYRSLACRSFPFFPYITRQGGFIGLSYLWEYEDRCWVISNLGIVTPQYLAQFITAYDELFSRLPSELEEYRGFSTLMRRAFGRKGRAIPLLHRNGWFYKVTPANGRMRKIAAEKLPAFGVYRIARELPFPDELLEEGIS